MSRKHIENGFPHPDGACVFLDVERTKRIYRHRPHVCYTQRLPLYWIEERLKGTVELSDICRLNNGGSSKPCRKMHAGTSITSKPISPVCNSPLMQASCAGCPYAHSYDKAERSYEVAFEHVLCIPRTPSHTPRQGGGYPPSKLQPSGIYAKKKGYGYRLCIGNDAGNLGKF